MSKMNCKNIYLPTVSAPTNYEKNQKYKSMFFGCPAFNISTHMFQWITNINNNEEK